jgi:hypothetical protein
MTFLLLLLSSLLSLSGLSTAVTSAPCFAEDCGAGCPIPPFPPINSLNAISELPDPFLFFNGTKVTTSQDWICRRAELLSLMEHYELGVKSPSIVSTSGTVSAQSISISVSSPSLGNQISFVASVQLPTTGSKPYPVLIGVCGSFLNTGAIQALGVAYINFDCNDIAQQNSAESRGLGKFYDLFGKNATAGALIAWAWGVSRLLDVVQADSSGLLDVTKVMVTGCSRNGKGALVVGALDERIALTIPQESGSGGSASWRVSDFQGTTVQTLGEIVQENVWFAESLADFGPSPPGSHANQLPFDHHTLQGAVAPRGLLVIENTGMIWLGNLSVWDNSLTAHKIYEALGFPDHMGISQVGNHNHCEFPQSQESTVEAFVRKFLLGDTTQNTTILYTDGSFVYDEKRWAPWPVPNLGK